MVGATLVGRRLIARSHLTYLFAPFVALQYGKLIGCVPEVLNAHPKEKVLGHIIIMRNGNKELVEQDVNKWFDGA